MKSKPANHQTTPDLWDIGESKFSRTNRWSAQSHLRFIGLRSKNEDAGECWRVLGMKSGSKCCFLLYQIQTHPWKKFKIGVKILIEEGFYFLLEGAKP